MSVLDGNETVLVQRRTVLPDAAGNPRPVDDGDPIKVSCRVQGVTTQESAELGLSVITDRKVIARQWPGEATSRVTWDGRTWDCLGEPGRYGGSQATRHVSLFIRTAEAR